MVDHTKEQHILSLAIVVCGWHFKRIDIYKRLIYEGSLYNHIDIRYYIASHRNEDELKESVAHQLSNMGWNMIDFKNEGWDWGAYQEFVKWQKMNVGLTDYYLFLHDDIIIKKHYFIKAFFSEISKGVKVVGNAFSYDEPIERAWPESSAHVLIWAKMRNFPIYSKMWKCVRGSCFFTTREVVETVLESMPIKNGHHVGFGNWSAILFGGLVADRFGVHVVSYLSEKLRDSRYILEEYRGGQQELLDRFRLYVKSIISLRMKRFLEGRVAPLPPATGLKLHLDCGSRYLDDYLNIDTASDVADLKINFFDLRLTKESVSAVVMAYTLERSTHSDTESLLERIFLFLKKEGHLVLEFTPTIRNISSGQNFSNNIHTRALKRLLLNVGFRRIYIESSLFGKLLNQRDTRVIAIK